MKQIINNLNIKNIKEVVIMKKLVLFLAAVTLLTVSIPLKAMDITVGAATWYSWWDMDAKMDTTEFSMDNAFLYGPALAVKINDDFGLNMIFLYGEFEGDQTITGVSTKMPTNTKRYDSDTSISYRLNGYFKLFAGLKYMGYEIKGDGNSTYGVDPYTVENIAYGPAAGLSMVLPIVENIYLLVNGSGMYLWGTSKNTMSEDTDANSYGYNTTASIAYYIASASVTLSIGGRYQYFKWIPDEDNGTESDHAFYGITAAATYTFSI